MWSNILFIHRCFFTGGGFFMKKAGFFLLMGFVLFSTWACQTQKPQVTVKVELDRTEVIPGQPFEMTITFQTDPGMKHIPYDGWVFIHFIDPIGNVQFYGDHKPPKPTSQWKGGETITYKRILFVPELAVHGTYTIKLGIYDFEGKHDRVPMKGEEIAHRAYKVGTLQVLPAPPYPLIRYVDGWHDLEINPEEEALSWRWTKKKAVAEIINPRRASKLYIEYEGNIKIFKDNPQHVTIELNGEKIAEFPVDSPGLHLKTFDISPSVLGDNDYVTLTLHVDKTFVPAEHGEEDTRELGIRVFHLALIGNPK